MISLLFDWEKSRDSSLIVHEEEPQIFDKLWKYMMMEDFILFKLTGRAVSDYSLSCRTAENNFSRV